MLDKNLFRAKYVERNLRAADVAAILGVNPSTLVGKVSGRSDFTRNEIQLFREALHLTA